MRVKSVKSVWVESKRRSSAVWCSRARRESAGYYVYGKEDRELRSKGEVWRWLVTGRFSSSSGRWNDAARQSRSNEIQRIWKRVNLANFLYPVCVFHFCTKEFWSSIFQRKTRTVRWYWRRNRFLGGGSTLRRQSPLWNFFLFKPASNTLCAWWWRQPLFLWSRNCCFWVVLAFPWSFMIHTTLLSLLRPEPVFFGDLFLSSFSIQVSNFF